MPSFVVHPPIDNEKGNFEKHEKFQVIEEKEGQGGHSKPKTKYVRTKREKGIESERTLIGVLREPRKERRGAQK